MSGRGVERRSGGLVPRAPFPVAEAEDASPITPAGCCWRRLAITMLVESAHHVALSVDERVCFCRPSIDVLFESAASVFRDRAIGVILSGGNDDGAEGLARIRALGGLTLVQDPAEALVVTMPEAAIRRAAPHRIACVNALSMYVDSVVNRRHDMRFSLATA